MLNARRMTAVAAIAMLAIVLPNEAHAAPRPTPAQATTGAALTIPWAIGGLRIERDGSKAVFPGEWPTVPVASMRIWDARTAWLNIEPAQNQWDFSRLDAFVAKAEAHGVEDIMLTLGGTPKWAAAKVRPTDAAWLGPGSASPPKRWADWQEFVAKVAERYQGRIDSYEIWNEPNSVTYWSGTNAQWAKLTSIAQTQIAKADPAAKVAIGSFATSPEMTLAKIGPMLQALKALGGPAAPTPTSIALHWYPTRVQLLAGVSAIATGIRRGAAQAGMPKVPLWITEMNVREGAKISAQGVEDAMASMTKSAKAAGVQRTWWYAWTDLGPPDLMQIYDETSAARWLRVRV